MSNHEADMNNRNLGTKGTNKTLDHNQGNRGKQLQQKPHPQPKPGAKIKSK